MILPPDRPAVMGILNVTPDSFSDGGRFFEPSAAIDHGLRMIDEGADLLDVGGESTRPGADPVEDAEELRRVIPVVVALSKRIPISIDTMKPTVAAAALDAGAFLVNDVSGLRDPKMVALVQDTGCSVCIMHMQGNPQTMQHSPQYDDVVREVRDYLVERAREVGAKETWIDPGIGFGKSFEHNLSLLKGLDDLVATGLPVVLGVSRKSFVGTLLGGAAVTDRLEGTLGLQCWAQLKGVRILRCHDVLASRRSIDIVAAISA